MTTHAQTVVTKKPNIALRDSSKLQLIHRQNSQASGINATIPSTERHQTSQNRDGQVLISHRDGATGTGKTSQPGSQRETGRNSIAAHRRQQQHQSSQQQQQNKQIDIPTFGSVSSLRDFHVHKKIGVGAYSEVYQVTRKSDGMEYALKQVKIQRLTEKEKENALNEVRILASINNQNVIAYKDAFFDEASSTLCIVMEFADSGDLYGKIMEHQKSASEFSEREIWDALVQMTAGLKALHDRNIFHRDLKSANIFRNSDGTFKMGDLNVSKIAQDGMLYTQTGTPYYASPEVWQEKPYDNKSDIWSLGCIIYEMCSLNPPFRAKSMKGLYNSVLSGMYPKLPQHYSEELNQMIKLMLSVNPGKRPSCEQLLQHESILRFLDSQKNAGFGAAALMSDHDKTSIQDALLQTIHCPRNLSQLSQILPRSKYQSGTTGQNNQVHQFIELPQNVQPVPQTAATVERKRKRRQNTSDAQGDRNNIIELAQQIVLPPIRESDNGSGLTILQQQQQRQMELLGLRRKTNAQTNMSRQNTDVSLTQPEPRRAATKKAKQMDQQLDQKSSLLTSKQKSSSLERQTLANPTSPTATDSATLQSNSQNEKKKLKSQLQIRQQIGRANTREGKSSRKQMQQTGIANSGQASTLASYPMDVANTLAAQNLQCLENYTSSLIDLPPSIDNIYATNDVINMGSRFNQLGEQTHGNSKANNDKMPNSSRRIQEKLVNQSVNQQITMNDLNAKQKYFPQVPSSSGGGSGLQRNNSQHRGIELLNGQRWSHLHQDVYASSSNIVTTKQMQPSAASAQRYQSVGLINLPRDGSGGVSTTATSNQGAAPGPSSQPQTVIQSGAGSTSLPGLKQNLQSMKSAKQLQKLTPNDHSLMNSMKVRHSGKQFLLQDQHMHASSQQVPPNPNLTRESSSILKPVKDGSLLQSQQQVPLNQSQSNQTSQAQLPPRQPSTTRNGGPTRNQGSKLKTGTVNLSQRSLNIRQQSQQKRIQQNAEISQTVKGSPLKESFQQETPGNKMPKKLSAASPTNGLQRRQSKNMIASQRQLREVDTSLASNLLKGGNAAVQASVDVGTKSLLKSENPSDLAGSFKQARKFSKNKELTQSVQQSVHRIDRDKSQIMVELMPLQQNTGRASTKMQTGRNHFENFAVHIDRMTADQDSMSALKGIDYSVHHKTSHIGHGSAAATVEPGLSSLQPILTEEQSQRDEVIYSARENTFNNAKAAQLAHQQTLSIQEKRSQLKQLRMQQQRINSNQNNGGKKTAVRQTQQQPLEAYSPTKASKFTKAQYHNTSHAQNTSAQLVKNTEVNSFEVPKQSHRILPVPKLEAKKYSQNATIGNPKQMLRSSNQASNQALPLLKASLEVSENENRNSGNRLDQVAYERAKQSLLESQTSQASHNQNMASSLEKKQQYLEQLRQLASIRHQKKNSQSVSVKAQCSVKTKKNGGNKAAAAMLQAAQNEQVNQSSPTSAKVKQLHHNGPAQSSRCDLPASHFDKRSSVPKLPSCADTRGSSHLEQF